MLDTVERKLATIRKIADVKPIEGSDFIELAVVDGWQLVTAKSNGFKRGDLCIYFEIDSVLPELEETEFLRKVKFRIKTQKIRGCLSQGIIFPLSFLNNFEISDEIRDIINNNELYNNENIDVTSIIGVEKYEKPLPSGLSGLAEGRFPTYKVPKTDEERCQNLNGKIQYWINNSVEFVELEKVDGSSATYCIIDDKFKVCSRNLELKMSNDNLFWKIAIQFNIEERIRNYIKSRGINEIAIQGELIGEGVQSNKYKIKGHDLYLFNIFNIDTQKYFTWDEFLDFINFTGLKSVPVVNDSVILMSDNTIDSLLHQVIGKSLLNINTEREGSVFRSKYDCSIISYSLCSKISFKAINNNFLLKYDE